MLFGSWLKNFLTQDFLHSAPDFKKSRQITQKTKQDKVMLGSTYSKSKEKEDGRWGTQEVKLCNDNAYI